MRQLNRLAFIGNSLPRRCGIATFTTDLQQAVSTLYPDIQTCVVAMNDHNHAYDYPAIVHCSVNDDKIEDYVRAADYLNTGQFDAVSLQHEFGIFGGDSGAYIITLLERLNIPVVTTLHTVLAEPTPLQRHIMIQIIDRSSKIIVMAEKGRELLQDVYRVAGEKICVIPHGIPDVAFVEPDQAKTKLGFSGNTVILTFGLLSPNKGIEVMIDAMPSILKSCPNAMYVILGATHPNLVRHQGEVYRESLMARAHEIGVEDHVVFLDQFVDQPTLLDFIAMCDVYVTPYLNEAQMTSGTLAYSFGLGKAVVSTPYWHAKELLADGRGVLVPFGDAEAIGSEIASLLSNDARREAMRTRAYATSRSMTWEQTATCYVNVLESARQGERLNVIPHADKRVLARNSHVLPKIKISHFLSMCDDTGLLQHAIHSVANRSHGYCIDDNARALLLACTLNDLGEQCLPQLLIDRLAAFVQHAWNPETKRFRNFMGFDRSWLEDSGSEDSHGRTLWALGICAQNDVSSSRRQWAGALFSEALMSTESFRSPRAWAFTLLGLDSYCAIAAVDSRADYIRNLLADNLMSILTAVETKDWVWFEEGLAYDNARLSQALILTGVSTGTPAYIEAGLRSLRWLMKMQTAPKGYFRPVGTESFGHQRMPLWAFDQQPLEATAMISACLTAARADNDPVWTIGATSAFDWFLGKNDLSLPVVDLETGSCRDGLHIDRLNENRGGESAVSYLLGLTDMRKFVSLSECNSKFVALRT